MFKINMFPEKIADLSPEQMQTFILSLLQHVNRSYTYNMDPIELNNRLLQELLEIDVLEMKETGCSDCHSCNGGTKKTKKPGKVIPFQPKN